MGFDPVTLALVGGAVTQGLGTVMQYQGQRAAGEAAQVEAEAAARQAESQRAIAEYNAKLAENQAKAIEQKTQYQQRLQAEEAARRMGALRARLGTSGVVTTAGSPLLLQATQASEDELTNLMIGYEGRIQSGQARSQAGLSRYQGRVAGYQAGVYRAQGKYAKKAARQQAGMTLLTGFGSTAASLGSAFYTPKTSPKISTSKLKTRGYSPAFLTGGYTRNF